MAIHQKKSMPNYQKLKTMVKRSIDQKLRLRNFDARNGRIETGAVVTSRKGLSGMERGKGNLLPMESTWAVFEAVSGTMRTSVQNRHQSPLLPLNHRQKKDGRNNSRRQTLRGWSPSGKLARQSCRDYIKGMCTRPSCDFRHPPDCQFYTRRIGMQIR